MIGDHQRHGSPVADDVSSVSCIIGQLQVGQGLLTLSKQSFLFEKSGIPAAQSICEKIYMVLDYKRFSVGLYQIIVNLIMFIKKRVNYDEIMFNVCTQTL